ncbi:HNH endonuclease [Arthrobacter sp. alpha11c]
MSERASEAGAARMPEEVDSWGLPSIGLPTDTAGSPTFSIDVTPGGNDRVSGEYLKEVRLSELWVSLGLQGICAAPDCGFAYRLHDGMCRKHWTWMQNYGTVEPPICSFPDCGITYESDPSGQFRAGMCNKHYLSNLRADKRAENMGPRFCVLEACGIDISRGRTNQKACTPEHQVKAWMIDFQISEPVRAKFDANKRVGDRRARKFNNPGYEAFSAADWFAILVAADFRCTYCKDRTYDMQMDHVLPLSKGGPHCLSNVTPACRPCNLSKHDSTVEDWRAREERKATKKRRSYVLAT